MIHVDLQKGIKPIHNFWNNFHFHPTDAIEDDWGQRILNQAAEDRIADTVRMYAMLEDIVTMDENGGLRYDFTLNDQRLDYMLSKGYGIFLSYNFIPACIATDPNENSSVSKNKTRYKGKMIITSPPKDYALWEEICYRYTKHIVERYGIDVISTFYMQCFNEPDIAPFFMKNATVEERQVEYMKLYRAFVSGVTRVSSRIKVGGPALAYHESFLDYYLSHVKEEGLKLDFVCFHNYGTDPAGLNSGERHFSVQRMLEKEQVRIDLIRKYFPSGVEIITDEWGAASNGFFNIEECPAFIFRENSGYAAFMGKMITLFIEKDLAIDKMMICLSGQHEMVVDFSGFRNFFTLNFIKKPIYNAYALLRRIKDTQIAAETDVSDLSVLASRSQDGSAAILLSYASEHFDKNLPGICDKLTIDGIHDRRRVALWIIDETHTNPYTLYKAQGMVDPLTEEQIALLRREGTMKPVYEAETDACGMLSVDVSFGNDALVLVELSAAE